MPPNLAARYVHLLATAGVERGLVGPRETDRLWERHVFNSAALADLVPADASVVDVGSGAGLPGIPLALRRPDLRVTLLEPLLRRATFLAEAVEDLDLVDRVQVVRARAEDHRQTYDAVASRALAPLPRLLGWCLPLTARGGSVLALKGRTAPEEVAERTPPTSPRDASPPRSSASARTPGPNPRPWCASTASEPYLPLVRCGPGCARRPGCPRNPVDARRGAVVGSCDPLSQPRTSGSVACLGSAAYPRVSRGRCSVCGCAADAREEPLGSEVERGSGPQQIHPSRKR